MDTSLKYPKLTLIVAVLVVSMCIGALILTDWEGIEQDYEYIENDFNKEQCISMFSPEVCENIHNDTERIYIESEI